MWLNTFFPFFTPSPAQSKKWAKYENDIEFQNTFMNLLNIALYSFNINGLPETCNERYFKLNLILNGMAVLVKDDDYGFLTLKATPTGGAWNMYGECSSITAYGWNGFNRTYKNYMYGSDNTDVKAIVCRDNDMCYPLVEYLIMYTNRLTSTMRTIDITAKKLKTPYFITCDEAQKSSVKKILDDIDFNNDSIITNKSTTPNMFQVLNTGVNPQSLTELWNHYSNLDSAIRTLLGVSSAANQDKAERLLYDEVNANKRLANINIDYRVKSIETFCNTANDYFGLNLSVELGKNIGSTLDEDDDYGMDEDNTTESVE